MTYTHERYNASKRPSWSADELRAEFDRVQRGISYPAYTVDLRDFGADPKGNNDSGAAIRRAVSQCVVGDTILIPKTSAFYTVDNDAGLSSAIELDKRLTVRLDGNLKATSGEIQANPPTIFYVTGDDVTIEGTGSLIGDGTVNDENTGTDSTVPSLVRVTGDRFTMRGLLVDTPPKVGIHLVDCVGAKILHSNFTGGPTTYSDTAYFAIRASGDGRHIIAENLFFPDDNGGMYVSCVFFNAVSNSLIQSNIAYRPYEKLGYLNGDYNTMTKNIVIGNSGTIPGANQPGTIGPCFRMDGTYNRCIDNFSIYGGGFQGASGGEGVDVSDNMFLDCGQSGITVSGGTTVYDYLTIKKNVVTCGDLANVPVNDGISVQVPDALGVSRYVAVSDNTVVGFSKTDPLANIAAWQAATVYPKHSIVKPSTPNSRYFQTTTGGTSHATTEPTWDTDPGDPTTDNTITWVAVSYDTASAAQIRLRAQSASNEMSRAVIANNNVASGARGISTSFMINSVVHDNQIHATAWGLQENDGGTNKYWLNPIEGASNAGIENLAATSIADVPVDFTPVLSDGTNNATMGASSANLGSYLRRGQDVRVTGQIATTALGSVSGGIRITGLPVSAAAGIKSRASISVGFASGLNIAAGQNITGFIDGGNSYIELYLWDAATGTTAMQASEWSDDGAMVFAVEYTAAQ